MDAKVKPSGATTHRKKSLGIFRTAKARRVGRTMRASAKVLKLPWVGLFISCTWEWRRCTTDK
eukprot:scaffold343877_cov16-Prasinocladus_malaysianus.AAC.1